MIRILLCCAGGMSTSLLVTKMEQAAQEKGIETKIWAVGATEVKNHSQINCKRCSHEDGRKRFS